MPNMDTVYFKASLWIDIQAGGWDDVFAPEMFMGYCAEDNFMHGILNHENFEA